MKRLLLPALAALLAAPLPSFAQKKVFIAPTSSANPVSCGGTRATHATAVASAMAAKIQSAGHQTDTAPTSLGTATSAAVDAANLANAHYFVAIASNAGGGHGAENIYFSTSTTGKALADAILWSQRDTNSPYAYDPGTRSNKTSATYDTWDVLLRTKMPAVVSYVLFDDCTTAHVSTGNQHECAFLTSSAGQGAIANALAAGTCSVFGATCPSQGCVPGGACSTGKKGVCAAGVASCPGGVLTCVQTTQASAETCDGKDNDCDGTVDNGDPGGGAACSTGNKGVCAAGVNHCQGGAIKCVQTTQSSAETCDGKDNDCDGTNDNGDPGGGGNCSVAGKLGICAAGTWHCQAANLVCVQNKTATTETCNNLDDDCNGTTDNGDPGGGAACSTGKPGACAAGTQHCKSGVLECVPNAASGAEVCDGLDNDCDGTPDNNDPGGGGACDTTKKGRCAAGTNHCRGGKLQCEQTFQPALETCNGTDDDCDGTIDNDVAEQGAPCDTGKKGVCAAGQKHCAAGAIACLQKTQAGAEVCDGEDNDCDGVVDNPPVCNGVDAGKPAGPDAASNRPDTGGLVLDEDAGTSGKADAGSTVKPPESSGCGGCAASGAASPLLGALLALGFFARRRH